MPFKFLQAGPGTPIWRYPPLVLPVETRRCRKSRQRPPPEPKVRKANGMLNDQKITRRYRVLALGCAAIVAAPLVLYPLAGPLLAPARAQSPQTITRPVVQASSFADIVAADRPAVVTITTRIEQQVAGNAMPQFGPGSPFD